MEKDSKILLGKVQDGLELSTGEQASLTLQLALPAILSQLTVIIMQYCDSSMVGSLGAHATAAIGLVTSMTWLLGEIGQSVAGGFAVQVAHKVGAKRSNEARSILRQGLLVTAVISLVLAAIAMIISPWLPRWLGGDDPVVCAGATQYFFLFGLTIPLFEITYLAAAMLRCAGNTKVPSAVSIFGCILNIGFNALFIFYYHLGVMGAALGSLASMAITTMIMLTYIWRFSPELSLYDHPGSWRPQKVVCKQALHIGGPMAIEHIAFCSAQVVGTMIIAPLGTVAIAANAFGIIIEGLCYMPGFGISDAATTLVGQSIGAGRPELRKSFSWLSVGMGVAMMSGMAILMYCGVPYLIPFMTPDPAVQELTTTILRIEALVEPFYAMSIVCYGVFVGAGDTKMPCMMNLFSIWCVRIPLALHLSQTMGLKGAWIAMAIELTFRGTMFLTRLIIKTYDKNNQPRIWRRASAILAERLRTYRGDDPSGGVVG